MVARHRLTAARRHYRQDGTIEVQRQRFAGALGERRRQGRRDTDEVRVHDQFDIALLAAHLDTIGGGSAQGVEQRQFEATAQLVHAQRAVGKHHDLAALRPALDLDLAAEEHGVDFRYPQILLREMKTAIDLSQRRQCWVDSHVVGQEDVRSLDFRLAQTRFLKGNHQSDIEPALAAGTHVLGKMVDLGSHRTLHDVLEKLGSLSLGTALDLQRRHRRIEIGNLGAGLRQAGAKNGAAPSVDDHAGPLETKICIDTGNDRPAGPVVQRHVVRLDGHQKLPLPLVEKRKVRQISLENQLPLAGRPLLQGIAHPVTRVGVYGTRQVAPDSARIGAHESGGKVDAAGPVAGVLNLHFHPHLQRI